MNCRLHSSAAERDTLLHLSDGQWINEIAIAVGLPETIYTTYGILYL